MAQFDLFRNPRGGEYPFLLDIQADILGQLATRVVVPLVTLKGYGVKPLQRLNPIVRIDAKDYVLVFQELAAIPKAALGVVHSSLVAQRTDLIAALDLLLTGV
jgi:toxin CcdB